MRAGSFLMLCLSKLTWVALIGWGCFELGQAVAGRLDFVSNSLTIAGL